MHNFEDVQLYKKKREEMEKELGRVLDEDEKTELYDEVFSSIWFETEIPKAEISDEEITGLKE